MYLADVSMVGCKAYKLQRPWWDMYLAIMQHLANLMGINNLRLGMWKVIAERFVDYLRLFLFIV
jgi:hypothetical protein